MSALRERICKVEGCLEPHRSKGLCAFHYQRHLRGKAIEAPPFYVSTDGPCLVEGCDLPRRSRGLCRSHYDKSNRHAECPVCGGPRQKKSTLCASCFIAATKADLPTERLCRRCDRVLPIDSFSLRTNGQGAAKWRSRCKECESADAKVRTQNARLRAKAEGRPGRKKGPFGQYTPLRTYAKRLGIPWSEVVERYPVDNRCEICGRTPQEANPGGRYVRLSLDHCHDTGALRGFLCGPCNTGLGILGDDPDRVRAALEYMLRHYSPQVRVMTPRRRQSAPLTEGSLALF